MTLCAFMITLSGVMDALFCYDDTTLNAMMIPLWCDDITLIGCGDPTLYVVMIPLLLLE